MSVPAYREYKDSGVAWLGDVPSHWEITPLRGQFDELKSKNDGAADQNYLSLVAGRGVMPYAEKGDMGNKKPDDLEKCKVVKAGNFVINSMNFGIGAFGVSRYDGVCSPVYVVLEPLEPRSLKFLRWIFDTPSFRETAQSFGNGILAHRSAIGWDELKVMAVGIPPLPEQTAIAAFLDRETAKIDALVAEQQRLIALLKEKRQAVISHAVTKGLNPNAPMKDSGIEWLGEIPAHWEVAPLRWHLSCGSGTSIEAERFSSEKSDAFATPVFGGNGLMGFSSDGNISGKALVIGRVGALCGNVHVAPEVVWVTDNALVVRVLTPKILHFYLRWALAARRLNDLAAKTAQPLITGSQVLDQRVPCPPTEEQVEIVRFIDSTLLQFEKLSAEAQAAITLLQERRAALISAAVTGKIDVRGLPVAPTEMEAA